MWEAMVAEMRAERAELDHRRHFSPDKKPITLTRALLHEFTAPGRPVDLEQVASTTSLALSTAAADDLFEMG